MIGHRGKKMNYNEAVGYIHSTRKLGWKLGLENMKKLLELMDNPHRGLKYVHIAGTNGKGSIASMISSVLIQSGYRVGMFTSPYVINFNERIRVDGKDIPPDDLADLTEYVRDKINIMQKRGNNHPTEFEIVTAIAFKYFNMMRCDIVVLEVGLGGRFDSTNIIDMPLAAVITPISFDHMQYLGNTEEKIAFEKAGIIKNKCDVVMYPQNNKVKKVIVDKCLDTDSVLHEVDFEKLIITRFDESGQVFSYGDYKNMKIPLIGDHQAKNALISLITLEILQNKGFNKINKESLRKGFESVYWPGRLEIIRKNPVFIIDGSHNPGSVEVLRNTLLKYFPGKKFLFIFGVLKDKDYKEMIKIIAGIARQIIGVTLKNERALPAKEFTGFLKYYCNNVLISDTIEKAIRISFEISSLDYVICAFGSLYYLGEIKKIVENME